MSEKRKPSGPVLRMLVGLILCMGCACGVAAGEPQPSSTTPPLTLNPDTLDQKDLKFVIQAREQGDTVVVWVLVQDKKERAAPVIEAWLDVMEGETSVVSCAVAAVPAGTGSPW